MRLLNTKEAWKAIRNSSRNCKTYHGQRWCYEFRLKTYYITPKEQLKQLSELGYSNTKMYSLTNGKEIKNPNNSNRSLDILPVPNFLKTLEYFKLLLNSTQQVSE